MKRILLTVIVLFYAVITFAGSNNEVKASLTSVTVFRVGAEMNHQAKAILVKGNNELVIENVSSSVDISSLQVSCNGNVTVMGTEFSNDYLQDETKTAVTKMLEDSLEKVNASIEKNNTALSIVNDLLAVLKANQEIKGTQTGLSVSELVKLMDYYKLKSNELQNELAVLNQRNKRLSELAVKLNMQMEEEQKKNTKTFGRLILQLNCAIAGKYDFDISYITQNAYWTPFYDLKAENILSPLKIVYRAKIFQTTGIDWKQVKLNLSTSMPSQNGNAPVFKTWFLSYINPVKYYEKTVLSNQIPDSYRIRITGKNSRCSSRYKR
ncbi:MAG: mucoidy inhibitor MuiA family protein [Ferruginibacter sp.]